MAPSFEVRLRGVALASGLVCGCGNGPAPACVEDLSTDCAPLYDPPVFSVLFEKTLQPTCATGMGTCHTSDAAAGGLSFEDADQAYALLVGDAGGAARVRAGDPACSPLVIRLEATEASERMPPGPTPLPEAERCAVVQWIANGAAR